MAYKRRSNWQIDDPYTSNKTPVNLAWSQTMGVYSLKFGSGGKIKHWDDVKNVVNYIKQAIPGTERDTTGPPEWIWYLKENHMPALKILLENMKNFDLIFIEKPPNVTNTVKFVPLDVHFSKFKELSGVDIEAQQLDFAAAKKIYFKTSMRLHPDKNNGDASQMYELNTTWDALQIQHFKTKELKTEMEPV